MFDGEIAPTLGYPHHPYPPTPATLLLLSFIFSHIHCHRVINPQSQPHPIFSYFELLPLNFQWSFPFLERPSRVSHLPRNQCRPTLGTETTLFYSCVGQPTGSNVWESGCSYTALIVLLYCIYFVTLLHLFCWMCG